MYNKNKNLTFIYKIKIFEFLLFHSKSKTFKSKVFCSMHFLLYHSSIVFAINNRKFTIPWNPKKIILYTFTYLNFSNCNYFLHPPFSLFFHNVKFLNLFPTNENPIHTFLSIDFPDFFNHWNIYWNVTTF